MTGVQTCALPIYRDARRMRGQRPFLFANVRAGKGVAEVADFICKAGGLRPRPARGA